jgi:plasmid stabilization system protein ParE
MTIYWTPNARSTFLKVVDYLNEAWTKREIDNFVNEVEQVLKQISNDPNMFKASKKNKSIRKGFVTKHTSLYYRVKPRKKRIELLAFWDNRQNP